MKLRRPIPLGYIRIAKFGFDESKHPRNDDGEFGGGGGGRGGGKSPEPMSPGERKKHELNQKLEKIRSGNVERAKKLSETHARTKELHSQLVQQLSGTENADIKATVSEMGQRIAETEAHTQTIEKSLRGEDVAADEHGQDSPEADEARRKTKNLA